MKFRDSEDCDCLFAVKQLFKEFNMKRENWENIVDSLNDLIYQYILSFAKLPDQNQFVAQSLKIMLANLSNPLFDMDTMLKEIPLHRDYFRKIFADSTGATPLQFLTQKRIAYAKQLLKTRKGTGLNIKEVALRAGFSDPYYFSRVFKKQTGYSPANWQ